MAKREVELTLTLDTSVFEKQLAEAVAKASGTRVAVGAGGAGGAVSAATAVGGATGAATAAEEQAVSAAMVNAQTRADRIVATAGIGSGGGGSGRSVAARVDRAWDDAQFSQFREEERTAMRSPGMMGSYAEYSGGYRAPRERRQHLGPLLTLGLVAGGLRSAGDVAASWQDMNSSDVIRQAQGTQSAWQAAARVPILGAAADFAYGFSGLDKVLNRQVSDEQARRAGMENYNDLRRAQAVGMARLGGDELQIAEAEGAGQIRQAKQIAILTGNTDVVTTAKRLAAGQVGLVRRRQQEFRAGTWAIQDASDLEVAGYGYLAGGDGDTAYQNFDLAGRLALQGQLNDRLSGVTDPTQRAQITARNNAEYSAYSAQQREKFRMRTGERDIQLNQLAGTAAADYLRANNQGYDANLMAIRANTEAAAAGAELIGQPKVAAAFRMAGAAQTAAFVAQQGREFNAGQRALAYESSVSDQLIGRNPLGAQLAGIAAGRNEALQQASEAGLTPAQFAARSTSINQAASQQAFLAQRDFNDFRSDINRRLSGAQERASLAIHGGVRAAVGQQISTILEQTDLDVRGLEDQSLGAEAAARRTLGLTQLRGAKAEFYRGLQFQEASPTRVFGGMNLGGINQQFNDAERGIDKTGRGAGARSGGGGLTEQQAADMIRLLTKIAEGYKPARVG